MFSRPKGKVGITASIGKPDKQTLLQRRATLKVYVYIMNFAKIWDYIYFICAQTYRIFVTC